MAVTLTEPEAGELVHFSIPIEKSEDTATINPVDGTPDIEIWGKATDGTVDSDLQIVDPDASERWIKTWFDTKANIRMAHDPRKPVGKGLEVEGHYVKALIADPVAKHLVRTKVLNDFSVGICMPDIRVGDPRFHHLDPESKAIKGVITDRPDGLTSLGEISIVDRGANHGSSFQIAKAAADGTPELICKMVGPSEPEAAEDADEQPDLIKASVAFKPSDLARLLDLRADLEKDASESGDDEDEQDPANEDDSDGGQDGSDDEDQDDASKTAEPDAEKKDYSAQERRDMAGQGHALDDGSYPIRNATDLHNAAVLARSGHGDVAGAKKLIARRAKDLGVANPMDDDAEKSVSLTVTSQLDGREVARQIQEHTLAHAGKTAKGSDPDCKLCSGSGKIRDGKMDCPRCHGDGAQSEGEPGEHGDKAGTPEVAKGTRDCKCGKSYDADHDGKFCSGCGHELPAMAEKASRPVVSEGVEGEHADPVPAHREPDGPAVESFEHDAGLPTDPDAEVMARMRQKSIGVPPGDALLHDLLCPAFSPDVTAKSHPGATIATAADPDAWAHKAVDAASSAPLDVAKGAAMLWQHAVTLGATSGGDLEDLRWDAHKSFTDANPGPMTAPTPGELAPGRFRRPFLSDGRAATPAPTGSNDAHVPAHQTSAADFGRDYLSGGHAADAPDNMHEAAPAPPPAETGKPSRQFYRNTARDSARQAMAAMHDHIAQTFPDLCPMCGPGSGGMPPRGARDVPAAKAAGPDAVKSAPSERERLAEAVLSGDVTLEHARLALGLEPPAAVIGKALSNGLSTPGPVDDGITKAGAMTADLLKSAVADAVKAATGPLVKQLAEQRGMIDALGDQPDPHLAPFRGVAIPGALKSSGTPAGSQTVAEAREASQATMLRELHEQWRTSPDPGTREAAWQALMKMGGLSDMIK